MSETVRPLTSLADWFGGAIKLLRLGLQTHGPHGSPEASLLLPLVWGMLARVNRRFDAVLAAVAAGRRFISKPRRSRAKPADRAAPPPPADTAEGAKLRLPRRAGWLLHLAPGINTNMGRFRLETLLAHPDLPALLEAAPHAARMLRPLARALLVPLPPCLQTARARAAAAKPAKPALGAAEIAARSEARRQARNAAKREARRRLAAIPRWQRLPSNIEVPGLKPRTPKSWLGRRRQGEPPD